MSVLSSIKNLAVKSFYTVADPVISAIAHPIKTVQAAVDPNKTIKQQQDEFFSQTKNQQAAQFTIGALNLGGVAGASKAVSTAGIKTAAVAVSKTVAKNPIKSVTLPLAVIATEAAVGKAPEKSLKIAKDTAVGLPNFASNVGTAIGDPSTENFKKIVEDNPVISGLVAGGLAIAGYQATKGLINTIAVGQNTNAINEANKSATNNDLPSVDYKGQQKLLEAQTNAQIELIEAQTKAQLKLNESALALQNQAMATPSQSSGEVLTPLSSPEKPKKSTKKKKKSKAKPKKKKAKPKKKAKKKTKKSSKKKKKAKKKTIKRKTTKKRRDGKT